MNPYPPRKDSKRHKIVELVNSSEIELTPIQIANKLDINHSTVKNYLRRLLKEGRIIQPYPGAYASKITYGMMIAPLRCHNLIVQVEAPWLGFSDDVTEFTGSVKVRVQFGVQRRRVTGRISCDAGMDRNSVFFALHRFYDIFEERTGHSVENVTVKTFELNRDVGGVRLDLVKCYTRKAFDDVLERVYQKGDVVRGEYKISRDMRVDEFQSLIMGGLSSYQSTQTSYLIIEEVKKMTEAIKFQNEKINRLFNLFEALLEKVNRSE